MAHGAVLTYPEAVLERARGIRLVLLDVDGVLTDGRFLLMADGTDGRSFHTRDGHAIRMGQRAGLQFAILSGRRSRAVTLRAEGGDDACVAAVDRLRADARVRAVTVDERRAIHRP